MRSLALAGGKTFVMRKMLPVMMRDTLCLLLETLVQGRANLYRSYYNIYSNDPDEVFANQFTLVYYYLERAADPKRPPHLLQLRTFRQDLRRLFIDCPTAPAITGKFKEPNLMRLVREYNACGTSLGR